MKLVELIKYFREEGSYEYFCELLSLNVKAEGIEIYMEKPFNINNDLAFFEIESTEGKIEYKFNNVNYFNLFDFYYFLDVIEELNTDGNDNLSNEILAERLYQYAMNDA